MHRKTILFFAQVPYLDIALEYIDLVSQKDYDVCVLIDLPPTQLKSNIFNLEVDLNKYPAIISFEDVENEWHLHFIRPYFDKCKSVNFVNYKSTKGIHDLIATLKNLYYFIKKISPDYIHFDDISPRAAFILPLLLNYRKKFIINIHDPKPHTGEFEWKRFFLKKALFKIIPSLVVYSNYSKNILEKGFSGKKTIYALKLLPYTVFKKFDLNFQEDIRNKSITFIGRISPYKGINLFINVIEDVLKQYPSQIFTIAGKPIEGFKPDYDRILPEGNNVIIIEKHLTNEEVVKIISQSQLIVCPYIEATQSGVIMTAYALNCPVLVTNVGGLPEYVIPDETGLIAEGLSHKNLADSVLDYLKTKSYFRMKENLNNNKYLEKDICYNLDIINKLYS